MNKILKLIISILLSIGVVLLALNLINGKNIAVLNPKGIIAKKENALIIFAVLLSFIVVVPVFILTISIAWKYREGNTKAKYTPDWDHNSILEFIWWAVPSVLILILSIITWTSSHELDPFKPIVSNQTPLTIQVVALDWKWLFIYPQQHIATVNFIQFPKDTPINFEITSDTVMNSFWIPNLGSQIYAMPGMSTQLYLMADKIGSFPGSSANISGKGFAGMKFIAKSSSKNDFDSWVESVKNSSNILNSETYQTLAKESVDNPVALYSIDQGSLYDNIIMKYMEPSNQMNGMSNKLTTMDNMNGGTQ